ncbi:hypothetical protein [Sphingomonas prati]|uniref:Uncharacterized protein n=1 Tax=Sphingomonas prati TaxID=1843237 RepID=A0A7W9BQH8_9SPHN|nr:hypothetical protein [Sphingomonas prati]MBB5728264.1 hypothetical protein [Sphingomonas prati]GGE75161.1 hypothetical protein GCM10011404_04660 [Sphingomonas prati]
MEGYKARKADPPLPPLTARHVFDWLMEVGPADVGAMGQVPLGWSTIRDWADGTFQRLSAWEFRTLRKLSAEYLAELSAAEDRNRPAPWSPGRADIDPKTEEQQLRAVLG